MRAFRGLILVFALSLLSLVGVLMLFPLIGGTGDWTYWQCVGLFGVIETASGLGNIIAPNVWRLPVAEVQTKASTRVRLAASTLLIPHWGGAARAVAGLLLMIVAAFQTGVIPASLGLVVLVALVGVTVIALSMVVARAGVMWPDFDVFQVIIRRAGKDTEVPPVSIGASVLQFALSIATVPIVKMLPPSTLFQPEFAPSAAMLGAASIVTALSCLLVVIVWYGRIEWQAPRDQQREAERFA